MKMEDVNIHYEVRKVFYSWCYFMFDHFQSANDYLILYLFRSYCKRSDKRNILNNKLLQCSRWYRRENNCCLWHITVVVIYIIIWFDTCHVNVNRSTVQCIKDVSPMLFLWFNTNDLNIWKITGTSFKGVRVLGKHKMVYGCEGLLWYFSFLYKKNTSQ